MSLHKFAEQVAANGRGEDSLLVHMTPDEVRNLQRFAEANGTTLTINPTTGLPEAGLLSDLFKAVAPIALGAFLGPAGFGLSATMAGVATGGITALATGSLSRGLMAGLGAYGGAGLGESLMNAGSASLASTAGATAGAEATQQGLSEAARSQAIDEAVRSQGFNEAVGKTAASDVFSQGLGSVAANPMQFAKQNLSNLAFAASPIMADLMTPTKTQMPDMNANPAYIRQSRYNPYTQQYVNFKPVKANEWGDRQFSDIHRGYNGGGIVALANGGVPGYADGGLSDDLVYDYFAKLDPVALQSGALDQQIASDMGKYRVGAEQIGRATGTSDRVGEYNTRFVGALTGANPTINATDFLAATGNVGLTGSGLTNALAGTNLSAAAQYALMNDISGANDLLNLGAGTTGAVTIPGVGIGTGLGTGTGIDTGLGTGLGTGGLEQELA
jgi:hypothetical protein